MKIYVVVVTHSCTLGYYGDACHDTKIIINATTNKEKAIKIADEYVEFARKDILSGYNIPLECYDFNDKDDIGEMYIQRARRVFDMSIRKSLYDYHECSTIEIEVYDD